MDVLPETFIVNLLSKSTFFFIGVTLLLKLIPQIHFLLTFIRHTLLPHPPSLPLVYYWQLWGPLWDHSTPTCLNVLFSFFILPPSLLVHLCLGCVVVALSSGAFRSLARVPWRRCILLWGKQGEERRDGRGRADGGKQGGGGISCWTSSWYWLGSQGVVRQLCEDGCELRREGRGGRNQTRSPSLITGACSIRCSSGAQQENGFL